MKVLQTIGGIGSQMMAYATYLSLKECYPNEKVYYDTHFFDEKIDNGHNGEELKRVFGIVEEKLPKFIDSLLYSKNLFWYLIRGITYKLKIINYFFRDNYNFEKKIFNLKGNYVIFQMWTSLKYFESIRSRLNGIYMFPEFNEKDYKNIELLKKIKETNSISIHIRRGDYVGNPILGNVVKFSYYEKAVNIVRQKIQNPIFYVFSDDSEWAKQNITFDNSIYIDWNKGIDSWKDMYLMSMCKCNIIPNSSFSWWAALLNQNRDKIVINPKYWSKDKGVLKDMFIQDANWIVIDNAE